MKNFKIFQMLIFYRIGILSLFFTSVICEIIVDL